MKNDRRGGAREGAGRPPIYDERYALTVRISPEAKYLLDRECEGQGDSQSYLIEQLILNTWREK